MSARTVQDGEAGCGDGVRTGTMLKFILGMWMRIQGRKLRGSNMGVMVGVEPRPYMGMVALLPAGSIGRAPDAERILAFSCAKQRQMCPLLSYNL